MDIRYENYLRFYRPREIMILIIHITVQILNIVSQRTSDYPGHG